jgi:hypothetical protein
VVAVVVVLEAGVGAEEFVVVLVLEPALPPWSVVVVELPPCPVPMLVVVLVLEPGTPL